MEDGPAAHRVRSVLLLLPPSEGKAEGTRGAPLDPLGLSFAELAGTRTHVLAALTALCRSDPDTARTVLGLPPGLAAEVARNRALAHAPTLPVARLYRGVLYDALDHAGLDTAARRRASRSVVVVSALWGALRLGDRVPAYRLSMAVNLPGLGPLAAVWRAPLARALPAAASQALVVDLRSATYQAAWTPTGALAERTVAVRVLAEHEGRRTVVSHLAKQTRGQVAHHLLATGARPRTPRQLRDAVAEAFPAVELLPPVRAGRPWTLEVVRRDG